MSSGLPGGAASIQALKQSNEEALNKLREEVRRNQVAEKEELKLEEKKLRRKLPSGAGLRTAYVIAVLADFLGFVIPAIGPFIAPIVVILLFLNLKNKITNIGNLFYIPEFVPAISAGPFFTPRVALFHFQNRADMGNLKDIIVAEKKLAAGSQGIFNVVKIGGFAGFVPVAIALLVGSTFWAVATPEDTALNPAGEAIVNAIPILAALETGGRVSGFIDKTTVDVFTYEANADPLGWIKELMNRSVVLAANQNPYSTEIEDTQGLELGLIVRDIQFLNYYQAGDPVSFTYFVTGGTFTDIEKNVSTYCYLNKPKVASTENRRNGNVNPKSFPLVKSIPVYELITCRDISTEGLDPGYYQAFAGVEYDFEVWAYIPYTFVSRSTFDAYGQDINRRLNIEKNTKSLSTNGPVILSISELAASIPQPYVVYEDRSSSFAIEFKLDNEQNGRLKGIDYVMLQVPKEFEIDCPRNGGVEYNSKVGKDILSDDLKKKGQDTSFLDELNIVRIYEFNTKEIQNDIINFRCSLTLPANSDFLKSGAKTTETIVATAKYKYEVQLAKSVELAPKPGVTS